MAGVSLYKGRILLLKRKKSESGYFCLQFDMICTFLLLNLLSVKKSRHNILTAPRVFISREKSVYNAIFDNMAINYPRSGSRMSQSDSDHFHSMS